MNQISGSIRGAVSAFLVLLCKGLMDDDRWDWDVENSDWEKYQECFQDPAILRTTMCVFMNNLKICKNNKAINYLDARYRAFQYFRSCVESSYNLLEKLEPWEWEEQDWLEWEG